MKNAIIFGGILIFLAAVMNGAANWLESQPSPPDQKFSVVDTYKGCDVVQYTPTNAARYSYFLDCTNEMMNAMPYGGTSIKARKEKYD
jgi:acyl-CoA synthetase (AMP-forming)/AMP-acid ligase II